MKNWERKEKKDAETFNAKRTPRSGGFWFAKGDSKSDTFLIECKTSKHNRYSITDKLWEKLQREAIIAKRIPLLSIEFGDKKIELVVLDKNDFSRFSHS
jgi:Holliday junction resolvase